MLTELQSAERAPVFAGSREPFAVRCDCGQRGSDDLQDALAAGWRNIEQDSRDILGHHRGICPECR